MANGVVYVGSDDHNVYALNASTGAKLWSYTTGALVSSSPAVANGVVYVGSWDRNVYALNASTGAKLWSYTTGELVDSSPAVANGVVYVGSYDHNVYALNANTGALLWSYATGSDGILARGGEWGGLYRLERRQRVRAERPHRRQAVEALHRRPCGIVADRGGWGGLYRLERHLRLCLQPEVTDRREQTQADSKLPGLKMLQLRPQTVRADRNAVRRGACWARTDNCRKQAITLKTPQ